MTEDGAAEQLDRLGERYTGRPFFSDLERGKGRDLERDPRASLLVVDPDDTNRFLLIRGHVELVEEGAREQLDRHTRRYTRHPRFYGYVYPVEQAWRETRITCRIHPDHVTLDAIFR